MLSPYICPCCTIKQHFFKTLFIVYDYWGLKVYYEYIVTKHFVMHHAELKIGALNQINTRRQRNVAGYFCSVMYVLVNHWYHIHIIFRSA